MRVFIAIPFSEGNKKALRKVQNRVREKSRGGRFSDPENFHLTLKFIGDINQEAFEELKRKLAGIAGNSTSFNFTLKGFGTFQKGRTHIPWLGVTKGKEPLKYLQENVENVLEKTGYKKESRPFEPHMTFGRKVQLSTSDIDYLQETLKSESILVEVHSISLMESTRINGELAYPVLEEFSLSNPQATE